MGERSGGGSNMSLLYTSSTPATLCPFPGEDDVNVTSVAAIAAAVGAGDGDSDEDPRTAALRRYSYGVVLPAICLLGIVGNVLNLVVLTRRNMRGTAYIYMRGYSAAALLAILFAIPFALRVLIHKETGRWTNFPQAFYHAHLELFLGNGCLGVGVMMLLALTVERYVSVCHPGHPRPLMGPPRVTVALIPVATFLVYLPSVFRGEITACALGPRGLIIYQKRDNIHFLNTVFYSIYKVILEMVFKVAPTVLLAGLNLRIMVVYRRSCDRRRRMTLSRTCSDDDPRKFAEERRLVLLLGSTSILFLVCVSPMVILNVTLSEDNLTLYSYQVFRALANLLEVTNYSITFYIYCLFSEDFRNTLLRTLQWPWCGGRRGAGGMNGDGTGRGGGGSGFGGRYGGCGGGNGGGNSSLARRKQPLGPPTATPPTCTTSTAASALAVQQHQITTCRSSF